MNSSGEFPRHHQDNAIEKQLEPQYVSRSDYRNYPGFLRQRFLSPVVLNNEKCLIYKGLGFKGLTSPDFILTLDEYQGFKYNKDPFISTIYQNRERLERRAQRALILAKKRSQSHGSAAPVPSTDTQKLRRFTSFEPDTELIPKRTTILSFDLLPHRNSGRVNFNLLVNLENSSGDENAIEEDEEDEDASEVFEEDIHDLSQRSIEQQTSRNELRRGDTSDNDNDNDDDDQDMCEDEDDEEINGDQNFSDIDFDDEEVEELSEEDNDDFYGQGYGYPYANKVPVIDIVVSDGEYDFDQ